jgi:cytochrome oxidase Cu insertion factor (SCO1/SenC/PrrC family)
LLRAFLCLTLGLGLAGCTSAPGPLPSSSGQTDDHDINWPVHEFSLTDQNGRTVTRDDLRGKVWLASFIFTRCKSLCPRVTAAVAQLADELGPQDDVRLVTFSIDPEYDTPEVLNRYAKTYHADPDRWLFLTGPKKTIYGPVVKESFHYLAQPNEGAARTPGNEVTHTAHVFVVDKKGVVRWYCEITDGDSLPKLRRKILQLVQEKP